jgi:hypothetical protein
MPVAASLEPTTYPVELRLSDLVDAANLAIFAGEATQLDYELLAANNAIAALANEAVFSDDLLLAAYDALVTANQTLVESINLAFSGSYEFLDSLTLIPA